MRLDPNLMWMLPIQLGDAKLVTNLDFRCPFDGRLHWQVCHFSCLELLLGAAASKAVGRTAVKVAELLMISAIRRSTQK